MAIAKLHDQTASLEPEQEKGDWGLALQNITAEERTAMNLTGNEGVLVASVVPRSSAARANINASDVILQVNRASVNSVQKIRDEIAKAKGDKPLLLLLRRADGSTSYAALSRNVG